jgi:hypothetical protein
LVGLHSATNLDGLNAITLMGSLPIACCFTCGLSWLCGHFLFLTLWSGLVWLYVSDIMVRLDSFSLLRTELRSYSTVLWGLFIPKTLLGAWHQFLIWSLCFVVIHLRQYLASSVAQIHATSLPHCL